MELSRAVFFRNPNNRVGRMVTAAGAAAGTLALLASCGGKSTSSGESSRAASPNTGAAKPTLTFDDLGGGSSVIEVFPSPTSDQYNSTYYDGDRVEALCKTQGRERHSDPSVGELKRRSDKWIRIHGSPGETEYATAVYVEHPQHLLKQLTDC
jgi:hypothetical protein